MFLVNPFTSSAASWNQSWSVKSPNGPHPLSSRILLKWARGRSSSTPPNSWDNPNPVPKNILQTLFSLVVQMNQDCLPLLQAMRFHFIPKQWMRLVLPISPACLSVWAFQQPLCVQGCFEGLLSWEKCAQPVFVEQRTPFPKNTSTNWNEKLKSPLMFYLVSWRPNCSFPLLLCRASSGNNTVPASLSCISSVFCSSQVTKFRGSYLSPVLHCSSKLAPVAHGQPFQFNFWVKHSRLVP